MQAGRMPRKTSAWLKWTASDAPVYAAATGFCSIETLNSDVLRIALAVKFGEKFVLCHGVATAEKFE